MKKQYTEAQLKAQELDTLKRPLQVKKEIIKQVELSELNVGDHFNDITPGSNGGEYVIGWMSPDKSFVECFPDWDKNAEHCCDFAGDEMVSITRYEYK